MSRHYLRDMKSQSVNLEGFHGCISDRSPFSIERMHSAPSDKNTADMQSSARALSHTSEILLRSELNGAENRRRTLHPKLPFSQRIDFTHLRCEMHIFMSLKQFGFCILDALPCFVTGSFKFQSRYGLIKPLWCTQWSFDYIFNYILYQSFYKKNWNNVLLFVLLFLLGMFI